MIAPRIHHWRLDRAVCLPGQSGCFISTFIPPDATMLTANGLIIKETSGDLHVEDAVVNVLDIQMMCRVASVWYKQLEYLYS